MDFNSINLNDLKTLFSNKPTHGRYAEALKQAMEQSAAYAKHNWGQKFGSDFPEIAREVIQDNGLALQLGMTYIVDQIKGSDVAKKMSDAKENILKTEGLEPLLDAMREHPEVYERALEFFYYGLVAGRKMQREEDQTLVDIAKASQEAAGEA